MPPHPQYPSQPAGANDFGAGYAPYDSSVYAGQYQPRQQGVSWYPSQSYGELPSSVFPANYTPEDIQRTIAGYDRQMAIWQQTINNAQGFEKIQAERKWQDLKEGRENALKMAEISDRTSRYGIDERSRIEMQQLAQNQKQFDATHGLDREKFGLDQQRFGLEQQKFGLDQGEAYTRFAQTYDDLYALQDMKANIASINQGGGEVPLQAQGAPHAKTWEDWSALTGLARQGGGTAAPSTGAPTGQVTAQGAPAVQAEGTDPRITAANAVMKAIPPSATAGHDGQDWAGINAITSLYLAAKPGQVEKLGTERQKAAQGALARAGYNPRLLDEQRRRAGVGQQSVNLA